MTALYLKYRPQSLDQLIGQEAVKKTLLAASASGKLSHAYLFVGPRGTGKTSTARILAKMVNCEKGRGLTSSEVKPQLPCNECATCLSITDGSNLDLIEIDAASNRGIDDIRALRETIKLSPSSSSKKVYIIDEVHMLTSEAFNALLKTLEEPPAHALFILATTEVNKVPQTILSRVQRMDFKLAGLADLMIALKRVADGEKLKLDDEIFKLLAKKADGSFRDGVKLLDQIASNGEISKEEVESLLQSGDFSSTVELLESIGVKDTTQSLLLVQKLVGGGANIRNLILSVMDILRSLMLIKNGLGDSLVKEEYGENKYPVLVSLAEKFGNRDLIRDLEILQKSLENLRVPSIPTLPLELAVVEICTNEVSQVVQVSQVQTKQVVNDDRSKISVEDSNSKIEEATQNVNEETTPQIPTSSIPSAASNADISKLQEKWTFVLETIRQYNFSLEALLRSVKIADCTGGVVLLEVPYSFHQRILETPKSRDILESILSDILSRSIRVSTVLGTRPQRIEDIANVEIAADDEIVTMASEIFNGKLVD